MCCTSFTEEALPWWVQNLERGKSCNSPVPNNSGKVSEEWNIYTLNVLIAEGEILQFPCAKQLWEVQSLAHVKHLHPDCFDCWNYLFHRTLLCSEQFCCRAWPSQQVDVLRRPLHVEHLNLFRKKAKKLKRKHCMMKMRLRAHKPIEWIMVLH